MDPTGSSNIQSALWRGSHGGGGVANVYTYAGSPDVPYLRCFGDRCKQCPTQCWLMLGFLLLVSCFLDPCVLFLHNPAYSISLSIYISLYLHMYACISISLTLSLPTLIYLYIHASLPIYLFMYISLSVFRYLSLHV